MNATWPSWNGCMTFLEKSCNPKVFIFGITGYEIGYWKLGLKRLWYLESGSEGLIWPCHFGDEGLPANQLILLWTINAGLQRHTATHSPSSGSSVGQVDRLIRIDLNMTMIMCYDFEHISLQKTRIRWMQTELQPLQITDYELRNSHGKYVLPQCNLDVFKRSFVNWSIFSL